MAHTDMGRKLGRKTGFRKQLLRSLATELIRHEQVVTTFPKAKECQRLADHLIAVAKRDDLNARKAVARDVQDREVRKKLFEVLIQRYGSRTGGCTRVFKLAPRRGDNAPMAVVKLIA